nr:hypothetical protein [Rhodopirellula sp. SM50]
MLNENFLSRTPWTTRLLCFLRDDFENVSRQVAPVIVAKACVVTTITQQTSEASPKPMNRNGVMIHQHKIETNVNAAQDTAA